MCGWWPTHDAGGGFPAGSGAMNATTLKKLYEVQLEEDLKPPVRAHVDDSMAPAIRDGDLVVLDAGRAEPLDGQVFVVRTGEGVQVKRLRRTDDRWDLESDNSAYEPRAVTGQDRILGQVAWTGPPSAEHKTQSASGAASGRRTT